MNHLLVLQCHGQDHVPYEYFPYSTLLSSQHCRLRDQADTVQWTSGEGRGGVHVAYVYIRTVLYGGKDKRMTVGRRPFRGSCHRDPK